jgi:hypothetical protein
MIHHWASKKISYIHTVADSGWAYTRIYLLNRSPAGAFDPIKILT